MHTPFLDHVVKAWDAQQTTGARCTIRRAPESQALIIEIEGSRMLATVEAWENQKCLDVTTLDLATLQGKIHSAGPTKTLDEVKRRLAVLQRILKKIEASNEL